MPALQDSVFRALGPNYEVVSVFFQNSEDLPAQLGHRFGCISV